MSDGEEEAPPDLIDTTIDPLTDAATSIKKVPITIITGKSICLFNIVFHDKACPCKASYHGREDLPLR